MIVTRHKIGFIGAGTVGCALAEGLTRASYLIGSVYSRNRKSAERMAARCTPNASVAMSAQAVADACDMVFVTTSDDAIEGLVSGVAWNSNHRVVHCSGGLSATSLESVRAVGGAVGSFHPMQTFVQAEVKALSGITIAIEAEDELLDQMKEMAVAMGCRWIVVNGEDKALYHVSGVLASNYVVTLMQQSVDLWEKLGIDRKDAVLGLMGLLRSTVENLETNGLQQSLTGPIARGDAGTVRRHLDHVKSRAPDLAETYRELGLLTLNMARQNGSLGMAQASVVEQVLLEERGAQNPLASSVAR